MERETTRDNISLPKANTSQPHTQAKEALYGSLSRHLRHSLQKHVTSHFQVNDSEYIVRSSVLLKAHRKEEYKDCTIIIVAVKAKHTPSYHTSKSSMFPSLSYLRLMSSSERFCSIPSQITSTTISLNLSTSSDEIK